MQEQISNLITAKRALDEVENSECAEMSKRIEQMILSMYTGFFTIGSVKFNAIENHVTPADKNLGILRTWKLYYENHVEAGLLSELETQYKYAPLSLDSIPLIKTTVTYETQRHGKSSS